jgi:hypothetical protein
MTRRIMLLMGVTAMLTLTAGGVWATLANVNAVVGGCQCETDPTCPPGCAPECPPDCTYCPALDLTAKESITKTVDCCDDPTCPPGCSAACPPNCNGSTVAKQTTRRDCPPCPFCP